MTYLGQIPAGERLRGADAAPLSVLLIGRGYAGERFLRAARNLQQSEPGLLALAGVVDRHPERLQGLDRLPVFADLGAALAASRPQVAIVTVNEIAHHDILLQLAATGVPAVICEKPLTRTLAEAEALAPHFRGRFFSLNLVERFSPVVEAFHAWRREHPSARPVRIEFSWGKHRIFDPRPSMGVLSELIHPVDLVGHLFGDRLGSGPPRIVGGFELRSDFNAPGSDIADSVHVLLDCGGVPVVGHASFAWDRRERRVLAYLREGDDLLRATLIFDAPRWDCDSLAIDRIAPDGRVTATADRVAVANADFPSELDQIHKVHLFLRESLAALRTGRASPRLVDFSAALALQRLIAAVGEACGTEPGTRFNRFS